VVAAGTASFESCSPPDVPLSRELSAIGSWAICAAAVLASQADQADAVKAEESDWMAGCVSFDTTHNIGCCTASRQQPLLWTPMAARKHPVQQHHYYGDATSTWLLLSSLSSHSML
jgi:hypothetical protein